MRLLILNVRIFLVLMIVSVSGYATAISCELSSIAASLGFKTRGWGKNCCPAKIITADLPETTDKMLAESFAIYAPMYTYKIGDLVLPNASSAPIPMWLPQVVLIRSRLKPVYPKQNLRQRTLTNWATERFYRRRYLQPVLRRNCQAQGVHNLWANFGQGTVQGLPRHSGRANESLS